MKFQEVKLADLIVNKANDRHGEVMSEEAAIDWLLQHRANHMRNLAKDITSSGGIFEPPLVRREGSKYVVYDGNRRTTALKLLSTPQKAPSSDWSKFFSDLRGKWKIEFPKSIICQIESDRERLDEILYRRHTGQQNGVGQSQWDAPAKTNFERRTGKNTRLDIAEAVEAFLRSEGLLDEDVRVPRSNLKRLLSAEQFRNRVGISVEKNKLSLTHEKDAVVSSLQRVVGDLVSKKVTLDDLWDNAAKRRYLDKLDKEGVLPTIEDILPAKSETAHPAKRPSQPAPKPSKPKNKKRKTLIRQIDHGLVQTPSNRKAMDIFDELQHRLKFEEHDNAISVLLRVLLELSIEHYISQQEVPEVHQNDSLANKLRKSLTHMQAKGLLDAKYADALSKFGRSEVLFSTKTLNSYIHSSEFFPSDHHLKGIWDTLERFVVICLSGKPASAVVQGDQIGTK